MRMRKTLQGLCVGAVLAVALLVLLAAPALAVSTHGFSGSFGEPGSGAGQLSLGERSGVAVNSATHDVYVADTGNARVDEFSTAGTFIRAWGWGVADGMPTFETCTLTCQAGTAGSGAGQLAAPSFIAVDNSGGPSEGDVYVSNGDRVVKFSGSGAYLSTNDGSAVTTPVAGPFVSAVAGVAVDPSGNLWVGVEVSRGSNAGLFEFAQDGAFMTGSPINGNLNAVGIAVDSADSVYYVDAFGVIKFSVDRQIGPVDTNRADRGGHPAVEAGSDNLYDIGEEAGVIEYASSCDPSLGPCTPIDMFGSAQLNRPSGLAVDGSDGTVYVTDAGDGRVAVFGSTPDVNTGQSSNRTPSGVTLNGTVDPRGIAVSDCHFDYVDYTEYSPGEANPYAAGLTAPCDIIPSGSGRVAVHAEITGLAPGVPYHFRLDATNANGTSFGVDQSVPGAPPLITFTSAANVASTSVDLRAHIDPVGGETTYRFEYGTGTGYGADTPVPDGHIGAGAGDVPIVQHLQNLVASTTYHYRVVAHNALGTSTGPDHAFTTQPAGGASADSCPNAAVRAQQGVAALPDCRAYEQVSPAEKGNGPALGEGDFGRFWQGSVDGGAFGYTSSQAFGDAQTAASEISVYLASRVPGQWSSHSLLSPKGGAIEAYSRDLSMAILAMGGGPYVIGGSLNGPPLVPGEPAGENLFLRDNGSDSYQLINVTPPGVTRVEGEAGVAGFLAATPDLTHVLFSERAQLTANAPTSGDGDPFRDDAPLYEWSGGAVHLVSVLPNGTPVPALDTILTSIPADIRQEDLVRGSSRHLRPAEGHAVSEDGSRVLFEVRSHSGAALYVRVNATQPQSPIGGNGECVVPGDACTLQLDTARGLGPGGGGNFQVASSDGSTAYFIDGAGAGLTGDTVSGSGENLYRYDVSSGGGAGALTDLTPIANAGVQGVLGASRDGAYVYFVANGVLAPGGTPGSCRVVEGEYGAAGTCNLYLFHDGTTTFIAKLEGADGGDWNQFNPGGTAFVSTDGRYLAFESVNSITGYDNTPADGNTQGFARANRCGGRLDGSGNLLAPKCPEVFLYDAVSGQIRCASCNPSGAQPSGPSMLTVPGGVGGDRIQGHLPRYLIDSGRLFFNSADALAPRDTNGTVDVYEYEVNGSGGCQSASGGCVSLISSGSNPDPSIFRDASATGEDVFFTTFQQLVSQDTDTNSDVYDARVDGGIASQNQVAGTPCGGESCKPPPVGQAVEQTPGSIGFAGPGNPLVSPAPVHKKPVKKKRRPGKKHHSRHSKRANHNRRGAK